MANVKKELRVSDTDIKRLNHMGIGLKAIAEQLGCHPATVTLRLKALGVKPVDTRRSFMSYVFDQLSVDEKDWLSHNLYNAGIDVREFVVHLLQGAYEQNKQRVAAPVQVPEVELQTADEDEDEEIFEPELVEE